jgi:sugar phosphate isomerase/epimerase
MQRTLDRRHFLCATSLAVASTGGILRGTAAATTTAATSIWPLYVFENGLQTIAALTDRVKLLKDLGYVGLEAHLDHARLPRLLEALDQQGLELNAVYVLPWLEQPLDRQLGESIGRLKGRPTRIELAIRSRQWKQPSDPRGDTQAINLLRQVSDLCADSGPVATVYPHAGFWSEKVDDGVRLARQLHRANVGTGFNLVHWYWVKQTRPLATVLREAAPHLMSLSINNGQRNGREISPLDKGDYDLLGYLRLVREIGYTGPVGLQCYSIKDPAEVHLKRSMVAWQKLRAALGVAAT